MRSDRVVNALFGKYEETFLTDAMDWFKQNEINLYAVQKNPEQHSWTDSPKAYASLYIDDAALGCPLIVPENQAERPYADWKKIREILVEQSIL